MAPLEVNQRTGRARRWKRSLRIADQPASWARDDSVSNNVNRFSGTSRGRARVVKPRQAGVGAGAGVGDVGDDQRGRSQSRERNQAEFEVESDDDLLSEGSADELDGGLSDSDGEDDGIDSDIGSPPATPISDVSPTLTLTAPDVRVTTTSLPSDTTLPAISSSATVSTIVVPTMTPVGEITTTATPLIQTSTKTSSIASHLLVTTVPLPEITSRPQKGIIQDETPPAFTVALPAIDDSISSSTFPSIISTTPSSVPFASSTPDIPQDYDREKHDDDDDFADMFKSGPPPPGPPGLSQASEHALIAVGSIGAFILFCFIAWIVYRTMKRYRGGDGFDKFGWRRKDSQGGMLGMPNEPPPIYEKLDGPRSQSQGFYGPDKTFSRQPGSLVQSGTWGSQQGTFRRPTDEEGTLANIVAGYGSQSGTLQNTTPNLTLGGRISDDQIGLANQVVDPYNTAPKQLPVYRISQLSSLSSGFGDGDIVVSHPVEPQPLTAPPPVVTQPLRTTEDAERYDKRETVYTQTSEDRPARFRSINSWVNQQTGRVQRASSRARERGEVPVMPAIPGEVAATQQTAYR